MNASRFSHATTSNSGGAATVTRIRRSWDRPYGWCPRCAGRRAVQKFGAALERLAKDD